MLGCRYQALLYKMTMSEHEHSRMAMQWQPWWILCLSVEEASRQERTADWAASYWLWRLLGCIFLKADSAGRFHMLYSDLTP